MSNSWKIVPLALAATLAAGCGEDTAAVTKPSTPPTVVVARPVVQRVTDREEFTGRTDAVYSVDVLARVSGYLDKVLFKDGADVKEGQVLFQIDPRPYQAQLAKSDAAVTQAEAHLKRLEADFKRATNLFERQVIGQEEYDLITGDRDEAQAALRTAVEAQRLAALDLEWTKVTARISGLASRRMVDPGTLIKASDTILTNIVTQNPLYVYFDVDETTLLRLRRRISDGVIQSPDGKAVPVFVGMADEDDYPNRGVIDFSENKTDPNTGTLRIRGTIENPPPYMLNPGMFVNVRLPIGEAHDAVLVPDQALGTDQGRRFVYVVNDQNEVVYRPVTTGFAEKGLRVVEEGLKPDERFVVTGIQRLKPGLKVVPEMAGQAKASDDADKEGRASSAG